jgi:hypothetical protein
MSDAAVMIPIEWLKPLLEQALRIRNAIDGSGSPWLTVK